MKMQEHIIILCLSTKVLVKSLYIGQFHNSIDIQTELSYDVTISIFCNILMADIDI